jgi:hypothetical protein
MGLVTVLGYLLERWPDVQVYRLFVRAEELREDYVWTIPDSQFSVDDWQLDDLDENIAVWGRCGRSADSWSLQVEVVTSRTWTARRFSTFMRKLARLVEQLSKLPATLRLTWTWKAPSMWLVYAEQFEDATGKV